MRQQVVRRPWYTLPRPKPQVCQNDYRSRGTNQLNQYQQSHIKCFSWSTWHPLKYKRYIYKGTHTILILHLVESKMSWRWELMLHKLPSIWHDSLRGLSNACNFQETKGGMRKKNGENRYNKGRKENKNKHEGWREEGKNKGKRREEQTEMEWTNE